MIRRSHVPVVAALVLVLVVLLGAVSLPGFGQSNAFSAGSPSNRTTYVIQAGDTLTGIARRFGISPAELRESNPSIGSGDLIRVGAELKIPKGKPKTGLPTAIAQNPERLRLRPVIHHWAKKNGIPADLVEATLYLESGWNQSRVSSTGAIGVGQIMPGTAGYIKTQLIGRRAGGNLLDPAIPEHNIRMSARYLRHLLGVTGNENAALHGYYQGLGSVRANGLYDDTKAYSASIQALRKRFRTDKTGL